MTVTMMLMTCRVLMNEVMYKRFVFSAGGDVLIPQQERSAEELRLHTSQVRVTLKSLRVEENLAIADVQRGARCLQLRSAAISCVCPDLQG